MLIAGAGSGPGDDAHGTEMGAPALDFQCPIPPRQPSGPKKEVLQVYLKKTSEVLKEVLHPDLGLECVLSPMFFSFFSGPKRGPAP